MARRLIDRVYQAWWKIARPMTVGVRGVVWDEAGRVLLLKHTYTPGWHFPGGGIEKGEHALLSLERELVEEVGVQMTGSPVLRGVYSNHRNHPDDHVLFYDVRSWVSVPATSKGEIQEFRFFSPDTPPEGTTPATLRRLLEVRGLSEISHEW